MNNLNNPNARQIIEQALSAANLTGAVTFASQIYRDEPISLTAEQAERYTPPKYTEMKRIAQSGLQYEPDAEAKIFYRQGKFMEDFEDDFDYRGTFSRYYPTYQAMNTAQLRGYFSWRTKVRRGAVERTQLSFAFVYIYELLNQIGVSSPEEGFYKLKNFRAAYGEIDPKISGYVRLWLKDYVVYNGLDKSLLGDFDGADFDGAVQTLLDYKTGGADKVFSALNSLSSYNLEDSKFFKLHPADVRSVVYGVFSALSDYCETRLKNSLCERFFGRVYASSYIMFKSAVFCRRRPKDHTQVYEISGTCRYICENGNWTCERFLLNGRKNQRLGALLKNIDFFMRRKYGFKPALKAGKISKVFQDVIDKAIDLRLEENRKAALPKIEIDVSKLQDIRASALETQNKLTVEADAAENAYEAYEAYEKEKEEKKEKKEDAAAKIPAEKPEKNAAENRFGLSRAERDFIRCLLRGEPYGELLKTHGMMLSMLVDSVNERLFGVFGDTVIAGPDADEPNKRPALIEDYAEALKGIIEE